MRSLAQPINWSQAQLDRQQTAGEVVGQQIREDRDRLARLASESNGHARNEVVGSEIIYKELDTTDDGLDATSDDKELITVPNSSSEFHISYIDH